MNRILLILLFTLVLFGLSAQENVFSFIITENSVTKNAKNTKAIDVNRVLLNF